MASMCGLSLREARLKRCTGVRVSKIGALRAPRHHDYGMELDPIPHRNHHLAFFVVVITGRRREALRNIRLLPPRANRQQEKQTTSRPLHLPILTDQPVTGFFGSKGRPWKCCSPVLLASFLQSDSLPESPQSELRTSGASLGVGINYLDATMIWHTKLSVSNQAARRSRFAAFFPPRRVVWPTVPRPLRRGRHHSRETASRSQHVPTGMPTRAECS